MTNLSLYSIINFRDTAYPVFESDCIKSIQSGCDIKAAFPQSIQDNTGEHISSKNALYGELTVHYWVWKNAPKTELIGFCHYRRFFEFKRRLILFKKKTHYREISLKDLRKKWALYSSEADFKEILTHNDVLLPRPMIFDKTIDLQFQECHGDFHWFTQHFYAVYPHLKTDFEAYFHKQIVFYPTLLFVTTYDRFNSFMEWLFHFLFYLEDQAKRKQKPLQDREFAFIAERLFGFYFQYVQPCRIATKDLALLFLK